MENIDFDFMNTKIDMLNNINAINKKYKTTHFEFINNPENWDYIEDFFRLKNHKIKSLSEIFKNDRELNSLTDELFWKDFEKILLSEHKKYKKENYIYNQDLLNNNLLDFFEKIEYRDFSVSKYKYLATSKSHIDFFYLS